MYSASTSTYGRKGSEEWSSASRLMIFCQPRWLGSDQGPRPLAACSPLCPRLRRMHQLLQRVRSIPVLFVVFALVLAACGDDDGTGSAGGAAMSDDEFCALIDETEGWDDDDDELASFAVLGELARRAPNAQLRDAFLKFAEVGEELDGLDEDDPEALGLVFELMLDPEMAAATATIEGYMADVCGIDPEVDGTEFEFDDATDEGGSDGGAMGSGSAFNDIHAGELHEAMASAVDQHAPGAEAAGAGIYPRDDATVVEFTIGPADEVDRVALCEALVDLVEARTSDPDVSIQVKGSLGTIAERLPGGACTAR